MIIRIRSKNPKIPITIISQFSRTGLQGSLDSPKSPPVVHHVPESQEQTCGWSPVTGCEQRPFVPHASTTFWADFTFKNCSWISWLKIMTHNFWKFPWAERGTLNFATSACFAASHHSRSTNGISSWQLSIAVALFNIAGIRILTIHVDSKPAVEIGCRKDSLNDHKWSVGSTKVRTIGVRTVRSNVWSLSTELMSCSAFRLFNNFWKFYCSRFGVFGPNSPNIRKLTPAVRWTLSARENIEENSVKFWMWISTEVNYASRINIH